MSIRDILRAHQVPADSQSATATKKALIAEIEAYQSRNRIIYLATLAGLILLLAFTAVLIIHDVMAGSNKLVLILGGSGVGMLGILEMMRRAAREWAQSALILGAARFATEERLQALIDIILKG